MNQEEFSKLPLLLSPAVFKEVTGLTDRDLREDKTIESYVRPGGKYRKFYKRQAARIGNFKM